MPEKQDVVTYSIYGLIKIIWKVMICMLWIIKYRGLTWSSLGNSKACRLLLTWWEKAHVSA